MAEMIVVKCDVDSKIAMVVCPFCGRISQQILKQVFSKGNNELLTAHACPVCGTVFRSCNSANAVSWKVALLQYQKNPDSYNDAIKENYANYVAKRHGGARLQRKGQSTLGSVSRTKSNAQSTTILPGTGKGDSLYSMITVVRQEKEKKEQENNALKMSDAINSIENLSSQSVIAGNTKMTQDVFCEETSIVLNDSESQVTKPNISSKDVDMGSLAMERKIDRWKKELLDTGKRNKMINYRETKRATLKILEPGATELFNLLAVNEKELTFQRPISKESDFRTYSMLALLETLSYTLPVYVGDIKSEGTVLEREKTLKNLRSKTKLAQEEQGTNILYLSFGFIIWREHNRDNSPWLKSPLLMMPVQLGLKSLNAPYTLSKYDDEIEVNPTLDYLFNQNYGIDLPTFELKNRNSFEEYMITIEEIVDKKGWKLIREVNLGLLSFLKISMYHDLNNNRNQIMRSPVIQAIAGNKQAIGNLPEKVFNFNFDESNPLDWHEVVDADSSQEEAILLSKCGVSFVMQGPPGTGKSQTITNIIAEALADGKKVLFVSEKSAALQVVLKRLTEVQLDDFCLTLHNYKANKKEIIDNIGENLRLEQVYIDKTVMSDLTELFHDRKYLNEYTAELHKVLEPFGESVYDVFGKLSSLCKTSVVEFVLDNPTQISKDTYLSLLYMVDAFEKALHNMDGKLSDNPWADTTVASAGQIFKAGMMKETDGLQELLKNLETIVLAFNSEYNTFFDGTWIDIQRGIESMETVLSLPMFPYEWRDAENRRFLREKALYEEWIDKEERNHALALSRLIEKIESVWKVESLLFSIEEIEDVFTTEPLWVENGKSETMAECSRTAIQSYEKMVNAIEELCGNFEKAKALLHLEQKDCISGIFLASRVLRILVDAPEMDATWFDVRRSSGYLAAIDEIRNHIDIVKKKTETILTAWESAILEIDVEGMLSRFKTEYTGMFYKFKKIYKEDIRQIKLFSKNVGAQIEEPEMIALLQQIGDVNTEKKWFINNEARLMSIFPNHYQGVDTDWDKITRGIQLAAEIANQFPYANISNDVISAIQEIDKSVQLAAEVRRFADLLKEDNVNNCIKIVQSVGLASDGIEEVSLSETVLSRVKEHIENERKYLVIIGRLDVAHNDTASSYADMSALISSVKEIRREWQWFKTSIPNIVSELDIEKIDENKEIAGEIQHAKLIVESYDVIAEKNKAEELTGVFGNRYTGYSTDWQGIIRDIDAVEAFENAGVPESLAGFIQIVSDDAAKREDLRKSIQSMKKVMDDAQAPIAYFDGLFPKSNIRRMPFHEVIEKYEMCINSFGELNKWLDYAETKAECDKHGLSSFTEKIALQNNTIRDVRNAFERGFYMQWLSMALNDVPAVQTFRRRVHEQRVEKFVKMDKKQFELSRSRIRDRIIQTFPERNAVTRAHSELRILQHEMEKTRKIMPLRRLFHEIPNLLLTLKPCLMMSPLSVAYFLNAEDYHFDMVIFDEASQIFPQDAIGAIFRADQVIIAGDTKQLPPTNFFSTSTSNAGDDYDESNDDDFDDEVYDSILEETANVLPNRTLLWHYRSKHEHLIAFSNQEIYRNELITFPSSNESEPDTGVEFIFVEEGYYEGGGKNCNILEAKKCVEMVKNHIDKHPERSLGIIAFSEKQQQAILREIQRFREQNPKYEEFFVEGKEDEFFVKNLENVQGDERDTIFFSIGYAKTKEQKAAGKPMAMRFGPLGVAGGERRLNVAITRAKTNVKLVSSILPSDIDLSRTESAGIRMLRSYIEFAMNDGATLVSANQGHVLDGFADAIYKYICGKGYKAKQNVGCSGYRIDIAVEHPDIKDEFVVGIECDGVSYFSARTARDRDRLRKSVLENMGWHLYRVWSGEWYKNPEVEGQKLVDFIDKAIVQSNERLKAVETQRQAEEKKRQAEEEREERERQLEKRRIAETEKARAEEAAARQRRATEDRRKAKEQRQEEERITVQREVEERSKIEKVAKEAIEKAEMAQTAWVKVGVKVQHVSFGVGTINAIEGKYITVRFSVGEKKFVLPSVITKGFLKKVGSNTVTGKEPEWQIDSTEEKSLDGHMDDKTKKGLQDELVSSGFTCIIDHESDDTIWVLYQPYQKKKFEVIAAKYHVQYKLEKWGVMVTRGKAAWRIMT